MFPVWGPIAREERAYTRWPPLVLDRVADRTTTSLLFVFRVVLFQGDGVGERARRFVFAHKVIGKVGIGERIGKVSTYRPLALGEGGGGARGPCGGRARRLGYVRVGGAGAECERGRRPLRAHLRPHRPRPRPHFCGADAHP
eukprot:522832-Prorocentrum_minimum.AAC.1